jgi:hypothetical protein
VVNQWQRDLWRENARHTYEAAQDFVMVRTAERRDLLMRMAEELRAAADAEDDAKALGHAEEAQRLGMLAHGSTGTPKQPEHVPT